MNHLREKVVSWKSGSIDLVKGMNDLARFEEGRGELPGTGAPKH
jgi:hypothetical protein